MPRSIVIVLGVVLSLALLAAVSSSCAAQRQAQATIEVARVAQTSNLAVVALVVILGLVILFSGIAIVSQQIRLNRMQQQLNGNPQASGWLPGGGQRVNGQYLPGGGKYNGLPAGDPSQMMMAMMLSQMMQNQQSHPPQQLPASIEDNSWRW
jgi:hypothetical protein